MTHRRTTPARRAATHDRLQRSAYRSWRCARHVPITPTSARTRAAAVARVERQEAGIPRPCMARHTRASLIHSRVHALPTSLALGHASHAIVCPPSRTQVCRAQPPFMRNPAGTSKSWYEQSWHGGSSPRWRRHPGQAMLACMHAHHACTASASRLRSQRSKSSWTLDSRKPPENLEVDISGEKAGRRSRVEKVSVGSTSVEKAT